MSHRIDEHFFKVYGPASVKCNSKWSFFSRYSHINLSTALGISDFIWLLILNANPISHSQKYQSWTRSGLELWLKTSWPSYKQPDFAIFEAWNISCISTNSAYLKEIWPLLVLDKSQGSKFKKESISQNTSLNF